MYSSYTVSAAPAPIPANDQHSQVPSAVKTDEMQSLKRERSQEGEEADDCQIKRMCMEKRATFKNEAHEKLEMEDATSTSKLTPPAPKKAKTVLTEGMTSIECISKTI